MNNRQESFNKQIINDTLLPYFKNNIRYTIESNNNWLFIRDICIGISTCLFTVASIIGLMSTSYPEYNLGFMSGVFGLIALKLKGFAFLASKNAHLKTIQTNEIFKNVGLEFRIPDINDRELEECQLLKDTKEF